MTPKKYLNVNTVPVRYMRTCQVCSEVYKTSMKSSKKCYKCKRHPNYKRTGDQNKFYNRLLKLREMYAEEEHGREK